MTAFYQVDSVGKSFRGRPVLKAATAWAHAGRITALLGRNGAGKTTLLRIGAGVLTADHGIVRYSGVTYVRPRLSGLAREGLFFLPDRGLVSPRVPVLSQLRAVARRYPGFPVEDALDIVGLGALDRRRTPAMSSGERRRAELAAVLIRRPRCLLADEVLAGIAPRDVELLSEQLRGLAAEGCAIVVTGHDVRPLLALADEAIWVVAGTTHGLGAPAEAVKHDQFRREYLGPGFGA